LHSDIKRNACSIWSLCYETWNGKYIRKLDIDAISHDGLC
jgi:hypothetical protein